MYFGLYLLYSLKNIRPLGIYIYISHFTGKNIYNSLIYYFNDFFPLRRYSSFSSDLSVSRFDILAYWSVCGSSPIQYFLIPWTVALPFSSFHAESPGKKYWVVYFLLQGIFRPGTEPGSSAITHADSLTAYYPNPLVELFSISIWPQHPRVWHLRLYEMLPQ